MDEVIRYGEAPCSSATRGRQISGK